MRKFIALLGLVFICFGASSEVMAQQEAGLGPLRVASKIDTEGALLGQMIVLLLQDAGFEVQDKTEFGPTNIVRKALISGQIDMYPEYTGNGGFFFSDVDPGIWKNARQGYQAVKKLDAEQNNIIWLEPAPANNTWAIAVRQDLAREHDLQTLEDLAQYVNQGGRIKLACSEEFVAREDALPAFMQAYGFNLQDEQLLILSGGNTAQTIKAAAQGTSNVNFAMAYGTDGSLAALGVKVLEDSLGVQPVYEPAPILRKKIHEAYPEIEHILAPAFAALDLETLQRLNAAIAVQGRTASRVAQEFLEQEGLLEPR